MKTVLLTINTDKTVAQLRLEEKVNAKIKEMISSGQYDEQHKAPVRYTPQKPTQ